MLPSTHITKHSCKIIFEVNLLQKNIKLYICVFGASIYTAVHGMADLENIALGRPAQHKGSDRYPTSGASRAVDGVFNGGPNYENCAQVSLIAQDHI